MDLPHLYPRIESPLWAHDDTLIEGVLFFNKI